MKQDFEMIEIGFASKALCKDMNFFPFYFKVRICDIFFQYWKCMDYVLEYINVSLLFKISCLFQFQIVHHEVLSGFFFINIKVNCNGYYFIFCVKVLSRNVKHIQTHNDKLHQQFVELRKKHNCSNDFYQYVFNSCLLLNVLPYIHN
jgi:hypothetical protein